MQGVDRPLLAKDVGEPATKRARCVARDLHPVGAVASSSVDGVEQEQQQQQQRQHMHTSEVVDGHGHGHSDIDEDESEEHENWTAEQEAQLQQATAAVEVAGDAVIEMQRASEERQGRFPPARLGVARMRRELAVMRERSYRLVAEMMHLEEARDVASRREETPDT